MFVSRNFDAKTTIDIQIHNYKSCFIRSLLFYIAYLANLYHVKIHVFVDIISMPLLQCDLFLWVV